MCPTYERRTSCRTASTPYRVGHRRTELPAARVRPGPLLRLRTWWQRARLDAQLSKGADPNASATLELRAEQLGSAPGASSWPRRSRVSCRRPAGRRRSATCCCARRQVKACTGELIELARRLRSDEPINVRGAAMTAVLLSDGRGPLYYEPASVHLRVAVQMARLALDDVADPRPQPWHQPPNRSLKGPTVYATTPHIDPNRRLVEHPTRCWRTRAPSRRPRGGPTARSPRRPCSIGWTRR